MGVLSSTDVGRPTELIDELVIILGVEAID